MWTHNAGNETELARLNQIVTDYNASQTKYKVKVQAFPQDSYNQSVDGRGVVEEPAVHPGHRRPRTCRTGRGPAISPRSTAWTTRCRSTCPRTVGKYNDKIYSYGYYDVALGMYARKSVLEKNGIRIPTIDQPWTKDEFDAALKTIKASGDLPEPARHRDRQSPVSGGPTRTPRCCRASAAT